MSRALLLIVLAVASSACSKSKDETAAAQPQPGETAGKVVEVTGKVTVKGKALAVGDNLKADDVIETGDDGRVVVELTHNLAHWQLGPNKQQKVSDSIAWKLPRDEGNAQVVIQDMSSAGRPAERSAADTSVSAGAPAPTSAPAPAPAPTQAAAPPAPPPPPPLQQQKAESMKRAPAEPAPPVKTESAVTADTGAPAPGGGPHLRGGSTASKKSAADIIEMQEPALRACLGPGDHVEIHVKVDDTGKPTTTIDGASKASVKSCLMGVLAKVKLPAEKASVNMTIDKSAN